ncbi:hypothetical protein DSO57_1013288 [Entomophthora muscae]|uniref:Uncharacterized protein n=1 Tax=Entomophthora muscae TaxID=34485 RepID=A0ACC2SV53_9FUNG|nr:hypothetical protein DSO57_1013288 [Entomophthora muscae]
MKESRVLFDLSFLAVILNLLLIAVALKVPKRPRDINLAIVLSMFDVFLALTTMAIVVQAGSFVPDEMKRSCRVLGPIGFILLYMSTGLVASISIERWSRISGRRLSRLSQATVAVYSLFYFSCVGMAVLSDQFDATPSGLDCTVDVSESWFNAGMVFLLGLNFVLMLCVSLYSYVAVYIHIRSVTKRPADPTRPPMSINHRVKIRIIITMLVYAILVTPAALFLFLEALQLLENLYYTSLFASILIAAVPVANACLVLFAHSLVFTQLLSLFKPAPPIDPLT